MHQERNTQIHKFTKTHKYTNTNTQIHNKHTYKFNTHISKLRDNLQDKPTNFFLHSALSMVWQQRSFNNNLHQLPNFWQQKKSSAGQLKGVFYCFIKRYFLETKILQELFCHSFLTNLIGWVYTG